MPETHLHETAGVWNSEAGAFISSKHQHLAEILHDYNPYFSLVWIPPKDRDATDTKPFAILNSSPGRQPAIIRYLSEREMDDPAAILAWVFEGDTVRHGTGNVFANLEKKRAAQELLDMKKREDELEDIIEFGSYVFSDRSPNFMSHGGQVYRK
jgi:hypothetical protein